MNNVTLIGRLTRDPELITTSNGTDICNMGIAVQRRGREEGADFVEVKAFNAQAKTSAEYLAKGRQVGISGHLRLDTWDNVEGEKRSKLYVIANSVEFLGSKPSGDQEANGNGASAEPVAAGASNE